jgi:hypothetical protein
MDKKAKKIVQDIIVKNKPSGVALKKILEKNTKPFLSDKNKFRKKKAPSKRLVSKTKPTSKTVTTKKSNRKKIKGKFIFTALNGLFTLFHSVKEFINSGAEKGQASENTFDLMTFRDHSVYETEDDSGNQLSLKCNERYYVPSEISWLVKSVGFTKVDIYGANLGKFSRSDALTTEDYEMLVIAER